MRECIKYAHDKPANYLLPCTVLNKLEMYRNKEEEWTTKVLHSMQVFMQQKYI